MYSRPQITDVTYMGGTGHYGPMTIVFGGVESGAFSKPRTSLDCYLNCPGTLPARTSNNKNCLLKN